MRTLPRLLALVPFLTAGTAVAEDLLPPSKSIEQAVDHYIDLRLEQENLTPAPPADGATLLRRLALDLVGRMPVAAETQAFLSSHASGKRAQVVDRYLASPAFVRHQVNELNTFLMAGTNSNLRDYLGRAVADNRPWDRIFRELLLPDDKAADQKGAGNFLRDRIADLDKLTSDVSIVFFGVNISCARCHDHPVVPDWKQDHFYGMKSFFNRTARNGEAIVEREYAPVKFKTTKGVERIARTMFLTGTVLEDLGSKAATTAAPAKDKDRTGPAAKKVPIATGPSARAQLVEVALRPSERDFFARAIVNRLWYRFFGRGLVMPLDQMHIENAPSHPELLAWLARDLVEHGYDLRRLIRGLVLSKAYARSSRWDGSEPPRPQFFAVAQVRPLTPMQLATSFRIAISGPRSVPAIDAPAFEKWIEAQEQAARGLERSFEQPTEGFQIGVGEALLFSNSDTILRELSAPDRLPAQCQQTKDESSAIDLAVSTVLCRPPTDSEKKALHDYLAHRADRPADAWRQIIWALVTSPELRFNH
jgi:hypothetical protein